MSTYIQQHIFLVNSRTVFDKQTGQDVRLSDVDLNTVQRLLSQRVPDASYDYYAPWVDHFTHEVMEMPLSGRPESKKSFIPSKVCLQNLSCNSVMYFWCVILTDNYWIPF